MIIGVAKETYPNERRVALIPASVSGLTKIGAEIIAEPGCGTASGFPDQEYKDKGVRFCADRAEVFSQADVLAQVRTFPANPDEGQSDLELHQSGQIVIGTADPLTAGDQIKSLAERQVTLFAMELMPRITRAQSMDVLSSMASIAGYQAVIMAAEALPKMLPMMMTAAGTIKAARVFVIGAGVAGLQAIATAKRLGAVVQAYDLRPVVKEQVESLGAKFVEMELEVGDSEDKGGYAKAMDEEFYRKQRELMARVVSESDIVITTAAIPGKKAPVLVTEEMVKGMPPGSVIVDLAAERGGNCELTKLDDTVEAHGVTILGPGNLPSTTAYHASQMYAKNIQTFIEHLVDDGQIEIDTEDEITRDTLVCRDGEIVQAHVREVMGLEPIETAGAVAGETSEQAGESNEAEASAESNEGSTS